MATKNHIFIAQSLDGFIADKDHSVGWLNELPKPPADAPDLYREFIDGIDAIVMGRHTFETVLSFGGWHYDKPVIVLSKSLSAVPEELDGKATLHYGDIESLLQSLDAQGETIST